MNTLVYLGVLGLVGTGTFLWAVRLGRKAEKGRPNPNGDEPNPAIRTKAAGGQLKRTAQAGGPKASSSGSDEREGNEKNGEKAA